MKVIEAHHESREDSRAGSRGGFTLIEIVMGLAIIVLVIGGVYSVASGSLQLSATIAEQQQDDLTVHSFVQLCRRNLERLPGNAKITVNFVDESPPYYYELVIQDAPLAFSWGLIPAGTESVILKAEKEQRGTQQISVIYYDGDYLRKDEPSQDRDDRGEIGRLVLLRNLTRFDWLIKERGEDDETEEWEEFWDNDDQRPRLLKLTMQFEADDTPTDSVFWLPPVANPATVMRNPAAGSGGAPGGGAGGRPPRDPRAGDTRRPDGRGGNTVSPRGGGTTSRGGGTTSRGGGTTSRPGGTSSRGGGASPRGGGVRSNLGSGGGR